MDGDLTLLSAAYISRALATRLTTTTVRLPARCLSAISFATSEGYAFFVSALSAKPALATGFFASNRSLTPAAAHSAGLSSILGQPFTGSGWSTVARRPSSSVALIHHV